MNARKPYPPDVSGEEWALGVEGSATIDTSSDRCWRRRSCCKKAADAWTRDQLAYDDAAEAARLMAGGRSFLLVGTVVHTPALLDHGRAAPNAGLASTYADKFVGRDVADPTLTNSRRLHARGVHRRSPPIAQGCCAFRHQAAADLPIPGRRRAGERFWDGVPSEDRVLDLSRAAMAYLTGKTTDEVTNRNATVITLSMILVVDRSTPLGPWGRTR